jgi:hypothetical protein
LVLDLARRCFNFAPRARTAPRKNEEKKEAGERRARRRRRRRRRPRKRACGRSGQHTHRLLVSGKQLCLDSCVAERCYKKKERKKTRLVARRLNFLKERRRRLRCRRPRCSLSALSTNSFPSSHSFSRCEKVHGSELQCARRRRAPTNRRRCRRRSLGIPRGRRVPCRSRAARRGRCPCACACTAREGGGGARTSAAPTAPTAPARPRNHVQGEDV